MVAEDSARASLRPGQDGLFQPLIKMATIEALEHLVQIVDAAPRGGDYLAPALAAGQIERAQHLRRISVSSVNPLVYLRRAFGEQAGHEDEGDGAQDINRGVLENI